MLNLFMDTIRMLLQLKSYWDFFLVFISILFVISNFYQEKLRYNFRDTIGCLMETKPPDENTSPV